MTTLESAAQARADMRQAWRQVLELVAHVPYRAGWLVAKLLTLLLVVIGAGFFALGWLARRTLPALAWLRAAIVLGWETGRSGGGKAGPRGA